MPELPALARAGSSTAAPTTAMAECFTYDAIRLENIVISLHRVTTAFKASCDSAPVIVSTLVQPGHARGIALVIAVLNRLGVLLALTIGNRPSRAANDCATYRAGTGVVRND